jgi:phasin family protein
MQRNKVKETLDSTRQEDSVMTNENFEKMTEQAEKMFMGPSRDYAKLAVDYTERMIEAQMAAAKAYTEIGMKQARAAVEIKDPEALKAYAEEQQKVVKDLSEKVKSDAEKVVAMNQDFVNEARKLVESNVKTATDTATEAAKATKGN